jgi:MFS-type transporter involved in bile tolerance (Atg22 family)
MPQEEVGEPSTANNNWGLSVLIAFASGVWILVAIPWFFMEKRRPGQDPGMNIVLAGFWQLYRAFKEIWQLRQSLFYLIGKFDYFSKVDHYANDKQATSSSATPSIQQSP